MKHKSAKQIKAQKKFKTCVKNAKIEYKKGNVTWKQAIKNAFKK